MGDRVRCVYLVERCRRVNLAVLNDRDALIGDLSLCDLALEISLLTPDMREPFRRMT